VVPVSTLQALAQAAYRLEGLEQVTAVLDARMNEVYIASFVLDERGIMQCIDEEKLMNYEQAAAYAKHCLIGSGAKLLQTDAEYQTITATAQDIASIARVYAAQKQWVDAEHALPVYLRDDAWKKIADQGKTN
ncbi:tRNA (adenosine(37)-N6)-threonylcarbamoyltransferase complex dimerization subunit type 1 TsaB, partial [Pseudomonas aeruginosa]